MQSYFEYSEEVKYAKKNQKPILALESTIITHGLPYPINLELACALEDITREFDVTPATIAVIDGKIKIGLSKDELEFLVNNKNTIKASRRDLPYVISQGLSAGTTVAATLFCAAAAEIKLFATGGIGGVHRGDAEDISADLIQLANTPVAVVCAGAKAILDLPKTLEFLETHSVPVIGYRTGILPAFYSIKTAYTLPMRANDIYEIANMLKTHWQLGFSSGVLIANPIPESDEIPAKIIEPVIIDAIKKSQEKNISGKAITPFLLNELAQMTQGKSIQANIALIKNNVRLGAELAKLVYKDICIPDFGVTGAG